MVKGFDSEIGAGGVLDFDGRAELSGSAYNGNELLGAPDFGASSNLAIYTNDLERLGFSQQDIALLDAVASDGRMPTMLGMRNMGIDAETADKLRYLYRIASGEVRIESSDDLSKHLKRFWRGERVGMHSLPLVNVGKLGVFCYVHGLSGPWAVLNSCKYESKGLKQCCYMVKKSSSERVLIETDRRPVLKHKEPTEVAGSIRIANMAAIYSGETNKVQYSISKKHIRFVNRYVIVASLKKQHGHFGAYNIMCMDGTQVWVAAIPVRSKGASSYYKDSQRVYRYGIDVNDIKKDLDGVAGMIFKHLKAFNSVLKHPTLDFRTFVDEQEYMSSSIDSAGEFDDFDGSEWC